MKSRIELLHTMLQHNLTQSEIAEKLFSSKRKISEVANGIQSLATFKKGYLHDASHHFPLPDLVGKDPLAKDLLTKDRRALTKLLINEFSGQAMAITALVWQARHELSKCSTYSNGKVIVSFDRLEYADSLINQINSFSGIAGWKKPLFAMFCEHNLIGIEMLKDCEAGKRFTSTLERALKVNDECRSQLKKDNISDAQKEQFNVLFILSGVMASEMLLLNDDISEFDSFVSGQMSVFNRPPASTYLRTLEHYYWEHSRSKLYKHFSMDPAKYAA